VRLLVIPVFVAGVALSGCAKKTYVQREVGEVNKKVEAVAAEVEKTQARVQQNEVRIDSVDKSAQTGVAEAKGSAQQAMGKAVEAEKAAVEAEKAAKGKLIYTVTLSNDKVTFPVNKAEISDEAKQIVDEAIGPLKAANKGVWFEIEGHTDSTGPEAYNQKLGEERAMAVRDYLAKTHGIALARLNVISYGSSKPVQDNKTKENRAHNRRVVINVLE
jgi:outer membrane protein OmpA-like peptidoglycan-associated protein